MDDVDVQELANSLIKEYGEPGDDELVINTSTLDLEGLVKYISEDTASTPPGITPVIDLEEEEVDQCKFSVTRSCQAENIPFWGAR